MEFSKLLTTSIFERRGINNGLHMSSLNESRSVIACLETLDGLFIVVSRVRKAFNGTFSSAVLESLLQVHGLFCT